jgi:hypothetical protein
MAKKEDSEVCDGGFVRQIVAHSPSVNLSRRQGKLIRALIVVFKAVLKNGLFGPSGYPSGTDNLKV